MSADAKPAEAHIPTRATVRFDAPDRAALESVMALTHRDATGLCRFAVASALRRLANDRGACRELLAACTPTEPVAIRKSITITVDEEFARYIREALRLIHLGGEDLTANKLLTACMVTWVRQGTSACVAEAGAAFNAFEEGQLRIAS